MQTNIIKVKYEDKYNPKTFSGRTYSYYTAIDTKVGDLVIAPTSFGNKIARVSEINVSEDTIVMIKPYLKLITDKIDKDKYLKTSEVFKKAA